MTSKGAIVDKLNPATVRALVLAGEGYHYKDQVNAWIQLGPQVPAERCRDLVEMSLEQ